MGEHPGRTGSGVSPGEGMEKKWRSGGEKTVRDIAMFSKLSNSV